jgi:hypothetical protein
MRNDRDMDRAHRYIEPNPSLWAEDDVNPEYVRRGWNDRSNSRYSPSGADPETL